MKCLGIHLSSIETSTQPATPAKQRLRWNKKTLTTIVALQADLKLFHHSNKGFESHSKCGIKHLHTFLPFSPSALTVGPRGTFLLSLPSLPVFDDLTVCLVFGLKKITTLTFIHRTWCCVCICSIQGRADVEWTARDNFTDIKWRWRFHKKRIFGKDCVGRGTAGKGNCSQSILDKVYRRISQKVSLC